MLALQPQRQFDFLQFALQGALLGQEQVLGELLGQRRAALRDAAMQNVGDRRTHDANGVDAVTRIEAAVLDGDEGLRQVGRQFLQRNIGTGHFAPCRQQAAVNADDLDGRRPLRDLQRLDRRQMRTDPDDDAHGRDHRQAHQQVQRQRAENRQKRRIQHVQHVRRSNQCDSSQDGYDRGGLKHQTFHTRATAWLPNNPRGITSLTTGNNAWVATLRRCGVFTGRWRFVPRTATALLTRARSRWVGSNRWSTWASYCSRPRVVSGSREVAPAKNRTGLAVGKTPLDAPVGELFDRFGRAVSVAQHFDTRFIRVFSFYAPTDGPTDRSAWRERAIRRLGELARRAEDAGLVLLLIGWALWLGTVSPWLVPPLFVIFISIAQIVPEEQALEELFGETYLAYRHSVRRWIGRYE